VRSLPAGPC